MGAPGLGLGEGGRPLHRHGLLMMVIEAAGLIGHSLEFETARRHIGRRRPGARFGVIQAPRRHVERIPTQPEPAPGHENGHQYGGDQQEPDDGLRPPQKRQRRHGKAFRSSSKWGPSRSFGQSPPHTMVVPCRAAAALKAAAMRG